MEDYLNGRWPEWKMTWMEDDLNGRWPEWKTISMEDNLNGRLKHCWEKKFLHIDKFFQIQQKSKIVLRKHCDNISYFHITHSCDSIHAKKYPTIHSYIFAHSTVAETLWETEMLENYKYSFKLHFVW